MRRPLSFATLILIAFLVAGCGSGAPAIAPPPAPNAESHGAIAATLRDAGYYDGASLAFERPVAPGVTRKFESDGSEPLTVHTVIVDMNRPDLMIEAEKGKDELTNRETVPDLVRRLADPAARPIVAVNGDFWGSHSVPIGLFVDEGMIWKSPWFNDEGRTRSVFSWDDQGNFHIGRLLDWSTELRHVPSAEALEIGQVNFPVSGDPVTLYTWPKGDLAPEPAEGMTQAAIRLDAAEWLPNEPSLGVVEQLARNGQLKLERDRVVIQIEGEAPGWLREGERVLLHARIPQLPGKVLGAVGGGPRLLENGKIVADEHNELEAIGDAFVNDLHPRTSVGICEDGKTLVFMVVDGRQTTRSKGINLIDLAGRLKEEGCVEAMNLDGGGSSTMVVRGELVNFPSDAGGPRSVSNSIVIRRTADIGEPARLEIVPRSMLTAPGARLPLYVRGYDEGWEPVGLTDYNVKWRVVEGDASVSPLGTLQTGSTPGDVTVEVIARKGGLLGGDTLRARATYEVAIPAEITIHPPAMLLERGDKTTIRVAARSEEGRTFWQGEQEWDISFPDFVSFDVSNERIVAQEPGAGWIEARYGGKEARIPVAVDRASETVAESFDALPPGESDEWIEKLRAKEEITALKLETATVKEGSAAWRFSYGMAHGGTTKIALPIGCELPGEPLAVGLWVHGDGQGQWLRGDVRDAIGNRYYLDFTNAANGIDWNREWRYLRSPLTDLPVAGTPKGPMTYPVTLHAIYIVQPQEAAKRDGEILLDGLEAIGLPRELSQEE